MLNLSSHSFDFSATLVCWSPTTFGYDLSAYGYKVLSFLRRLQGYYKGIPAVNCSVEHRRMSREQGGGLSPPGYALKGRKYTPPAFGAWL